jgi:hypothetical protein
MIWRLVATAGRQPKRFDQLLIVLEDGERTVALGDPQSQQPMHLAFSMWVPWSNVRTEQRLRITGIVGRFRWSGELDVDGLVAVSQMCGQRRDVARVDELRAAQGTQPETLAVYRELREVLPPHCGLLAPLWVGGIIGRKYSLAYREIIKC